MPQNAYREHVEATAKYRLSVVSNPADDLIKVESEINSGQVEELIEAAKDEINLMNHLKERNYFDNE